MVTNKLYLDDRNNEYIVLCKFGSHTISGCRVTGVGPPEPPPPGPGKQKKPGLNRVKSSEIRLVLEDFLRIFVSKQNFRSAVFIRG